MRGQGRGEDCWARSAWRVGSRLTMIVTWVVLAAGLLRPVRAEGPNRVGIWVGGTKKCATFSGDSINALAALQQAYDIESSSGAVCKIGGTGCPAGDCWCKCPVPDDKCEFWSYWHLKGDQWVYGNVGASQYQLRNGDIDGWLWGHQPQNGNSGPSEKPSIDDFCPRSTDTPVPTNTPVPTDTPAPTLTPTPAPTPTKKPTATKAPAGQHRLLSEPGTGDTGCVRQPAVACEERQRRVSQRRWRAR